MRRFYAPQDQISDSHITLDESETHHARQVLRLQSGDEVSVFDGEGREYLCRIVSIEKRTANLVIESEVTPSAPESPVEITLVAAILKGDKTDTVVQKAVELGVTRFVPLLSARCEAKFKDAGKKMIRWERIALDASKQCGRTRLMTVQEPTSLISFLESCVDGTRIFFSERDGAKLGTMSAGKNITAVVGPEGGWEDLEIETASGCGFQLVTLGGRVLRADTAAIAITAILQHHHGDLN